MYLRALWIQKILLAPHVDLSSLMRASLCKYRSPISLVLNVAVVHSSVDCLISLVTLFCEWSTSKISENIADTIINIVCEKLYIAFRYYRKFTESIASLLHRIGLHAANGEARNNIQHIGLVEWMRCNFAFAVLPSPLIRNPRKSIINQSKMLFIVYSHNTRFIHKQAREMSE